MGHFFGRSYLRLASINQVNKRLFCIHRTTQFICKKNSKMLLAFFHVGVDIDRIDCLVEKKLISPGKTNVVIHGTTSLRCGLVHGKFSGHTCREFVTVIEKRNI